MVRNTFSEGFLKTFLTYDQIIMHSSLSQSECTFVSRNSLKASLRYIVLTTMGWKMNYMYGQMYRQPENIMPLASAVAGIKILISAALKRRHTTPDSDEEARQSSRL